MVFYLIEDIKRETGLPDAVFCLIAILLVLLTSIVWVTFCVVLHKTVYRMAEMKRQQRRQQIIASAFAHTMHEYPHLHGAPSINYIAQLSQLDPVIFANSQTYEYNPTELPTYAEALQLPSPLSAERINSIQANDSAPNDSLSETSNGLTNQLNISTDLSNVKNATSDARNQTVSSNTRFRERATSQGASSSTTPPPYTAVEE